jgi:hypothetical protein
MTSVVDDYGFIAGRMKQIQDEDGGLSSSPVQIFNSVKQALDYLNTQDTITKVWVAWPNDMGYIVVQGCRRGAAVFYTMAGVSTSEHYACAT